MVDFQKSSRKLDAMILRVTEYDEPILRKTGEKVVEFGDKLKKLSDDMLDTMREYEGTGIAAQQVDEDLQFFVLDISWHPELSSIPFELDGKKVPLELMMPLCMANVELEKLPGDTEIAEEGCLSFPAVKGNVERALSIRCKYQDLDGIKHTMLAGDWLARVIQHEYDHNQGVLFIDHLSKRDIKAAESKIKRIKRRTRDRMRMLKAAKRKET